MNHGDLSCVFSTLILTLTPFVEQKQSEEGMMTFRSTWFSLEAHFWLYQFLHKAKKNIIIIFSK